MTHQQRVNHSGSVVTERTVGDDVNVYGLCSYWRKTFWAHAVIQMKWC